MLDKLDYTRPNQDKHMLTTIIILPSGHIGISGWLTKTDICRKASAKVNLWHWQWIILLTFIIIIFILNSLVTNHDELHCLSGYEILRKLSIYCVSCLFSLRKYVKLTEQIWGSYMIPNANRSATQLNLDQFNIKIQQVKQ